MEINHTLWANTYLPNMARKWHYSYNLDEEDTLCELYEQYTEALNHFDESRGISFDNFFFFYKKKALNNLLTERKKWEEWHVVDSELLQIVECTVDDIAKIINEVDKVSLDNDSLTMLQFILEHEFSTNKERNRVGKETVCREITQTLQWTWNRARHALDSIQGFYADRCFA